MDCDEIRRTMSDADGRTVRARRVRAHLHECAGCAAFAATIPARSAELRALAPSLPMLAAAGLLERSLGPGPVHGAGIGLTTALAGKTASVALSANALAGAAVVATATVGVTLGVGTLVQHHGHAVRIGATAPAITAGSRAAPASQAGDAAASSGGRLVYPGRANGTTSATPSHTPGATAGGASHSVPRKAAKVGSTSLGHSGGRGHPGTAPGHGNATAGHARAVRSRGDGAGGLFGGAPGHARFTAPGHAGAAPGHARAIPGYAGTAPGHARATPGHAGVAPGHSDGAPGHAGTAPGHTGATPGQAGATPGQAGATRGQTGTTRGDGAPLVGSPRSAAKKS